VSDLRAVNARLRQVLADKDELIASQDTLLGMQRNQLADQDEQLAAKDELLAGKDELLAGKDELIAEQAKLIALVEEQNAELRRRLGMDSTNSSAPPSTDSIAAKAKRRKANSERTRSRSRQPGGQKGHPGSGLELAPQVDDTVPIEPAECSTCGEHLDADSPCEGFTPVQQWDIPPVALTKIQFDLMRRRCTAGHVTQAPAPAGVSGPVCYGPNVRAFAAHIAYRGHVSMERTAEMLAELFGAAVSTGFVASCLDRLSSTLAGFETDLKQALIAARRLHHDETPVPVGGGTAYVYNARTTDLIWYGAYETRSHAALDSFDILPRFTGVLIRDDWHGYHKYSDPARGGVIAHVQLCCAHVMRELKAVWEANPQRQAWAEQMRQTLKKARRAVDTAIDTDAAGLAPGAIAGLRELYLNTAEQGITANTPGTTGRSHDAYKLAKRMRDRIDQVLYFTVDFQTEWTNNPSEQAIRTAKLQAKISGSWRSMRGLTAFCRIRSYIATAKAHGAAVFTALRDAFLGNPWTVPTTV
jgi:transposase